jgi:hypothetical protein
MGADPKRSTAVPVALAMLLLLIPFVGYAAGYIALSS